MNPHTLSRYVLEKQFTHNGETAVSLFHTITEAFYTIPDHQWHSLLDPGAPDTDPDIAKELYGSGILIEKGADETPAYRRWRARHNYQQAFLRFKTLVTRICNNRCTYCVIDAEAKIMTPETVRAANRFVFEQIDEKSPESVHDDFSGGEPMLAPGIILQAARARQLYCRERGIDYSFSITSNGTRLFPEVVDSLLTFGLDHIRVSLAGPAPLHNRLRPCVDHDNPYAIILKHLEKVARMVPVGVECQYDAGAADYRIIPEMLDELAQRGIPIKEVAFTHIMETRRDTPFKAGGNIDIHLYLLEEAHKRGFPEYDRPPRSGCMADFESTFVIDTDGSIIPCPSLQGGELTYGNVFTGVDFLAESALIERRLPRRCRTACELLPLCGGGCRLQAQTKTGDFNAVYCNYDTLRIMTEHWMEKKALASLAEEGANAG